MEIFSEIFEEVKENTKLKNEISKDLTKIKTLNLATQSEALIKETIINKRNLKILQIAGEQMIELQDDLDVAENKVQILEKKIGKNNLDQKYLDFMDLFEKNIKNKPTSSKIMRMKEKLINKYN